MPAWKDRRRAQAGTTLIELLVSLVIVGLALVLIVGTFSTGLLDATLAKRNTAVQAVMQYELDQISGSQFNTSAESKSECFATENTNSPAPSSPMYQGSCPSGYTLRADLLLTTQAAPARRQLWTVSVAVWPDGTQVVSSLDVYKVNR